MSTLTLILASVLAAAPPNSAPVEAADDADWTPLFNGENLTGFYTFLQTHGKNADPDGIVTVEDGAIHLYKNVPDQGRVVMGYIATEKEYGDYHLSLQYRFGERKFEPRYKLNRDAGVYYHMTGPDAVWPRGLQYQIEQTNVGDLITLFGMRLDTTVDPKTADFIMPRYPAYLPRENGGRPRVLGGPGSLYQAHLAGSVENDGWNTVEIVAGGTEIVHLLNGQVVNRGAAPRFVDPADPDARPVPVVRGRIALEIEAAEIWYRDVKIRPLKGSRGTAQ